VRKKPQNKGALAPVFGGAGFQPRRNRLAFLGALAPEAKFLDEPSTGETAVTKDDALNLANHWVAAWNAHDLDSIMTHYDDAVELTSPVAAKLLGTSNGKVVGKANLRAYFQRGLEAYPELHFHVEDVLWGLNSVVLYYTNQKGTRTAEFMELSATGKVVRVVANYNA
jgi:predicted ester cyclase